MQDLLTPAYDRIRLQTWPIGSGIYSDKSFTIGDRIKIGAARARA